MQDYSDDLTAVLFGEEFAKRIKMIEKINRQQKLKKYIIALGLLLVMTIIIGVGFALAFI